jgi:hypothetical protein
MGTFNTKFITGKILMRKFLNTLLNFVGNKNKE